MIFKKALAALGEDAVVLDEVILFIYEIIIVLWFSGSSVRLLIEFLT